MLLFDFNQIGKRVLQLRRSRGMTQEEVAEQAGVSLRTYADMERGTGKIRLETLLCICKVLDITPDDILVGDFGKEDEDKETAVLERLNLCGRSERRTAIQLLEVYLKSLNNG